jgi:hypothetical protein
MSDRPAIVYCRCAYAQVVPEAVKDGVLDRLCASGESFDSVADLCEMSARKDPRLEAIAKGGSVRIAACHPRAVKWLFHAAGTPLDEAAAEIVNMRDDDAETVAHKLMAEEGAPVEKS